VLSLGDFLEQTPARTPTTAPPSHEMSSDAALFLDREARKNRSFTELGLLRIERGEFFERVVSRENLARRCLRPHG